MAIKIRQNGIVKDLVINASEVAVLDVDGNFKSKNLETILKQIATTGTGGSGTGGSGYPSDAEFVYVKDTEPDMDGVWLDESDVTSDDSSVGSNSVVKEIKSYVNSETSKINASLTNAKAELEEKDAELLNKIGILNNGVNQISNPNLLINGDFRVWQRGNSFDSDNVSLQKKYVADRWQVDLQTGSYILRQSNDSILISPKSPGWHCNIRQILEENDILKLQGQTVTFSVNISFANAQNLCIVIKDDKEVFKRIQCKNGLNILTCTLPNSRRIVNLQCSIDFYTIEQTVSDLYIANAKLELGSVATPFVPRHYGEELALCQRYYQKFSANGVPISTNNLSFQHSYPVTMRTKPTIVLQSNNLFCSETASQVSFTINGSNTQNDYLQNVVSSVATLTLGRHYHGSFLLDAEIY